MAKRQRKPPRKIETLTHGEASRRNIPTAEFRSVMDRSEQSPVRVAYERRNRDLDPQLVWRGKDGQDWSDLVVQAPPLYIQEKVHPKVLIDDLRRRTEDRRRDRENRASESQPDLFADFNGLPDEGAKTEFYQHDANWSNRMILGDSLQVMASLAEREGLRGKVQCIYLDPPYGIKFNSNFQWSTTSRDVKDGKAEHISREPEQVKAFRDTWRDGVHSYLTYLRDRLTVARDLLAESDSIFVQIGDENVHRVRALMDEIVGPENLCAQIGVLKTAGQSAELIAGTADYVLWYAKRRAAVKFRPPFIDKSLGTDKAGVYRWVSKPDGQVHPLTDQERLQGRTASVFRYDNLTSQRAPGSFPVTCGGKTYRPGKGYWKTGEVGMSRLIKAGRVGQATNSLTYIRYLEDFGAQALGSVWTDTGTGSFTDEKIYVVQSGTKLIQRCVLMATDPGDLVLDPTCGSATTAYVAEHWGYGPRQDFAGMILEQLATAGVQQAHKEDRISFAAVTPWPGEYVCAEGRYVDDRSGARPEKRAGIFVGPEFGTVSRPDFVAAAREAGDAGFDVLIACAFNYEAHASEFDRLGRIPVLKARMNADLHMAGELKNTGKGNLFVIFGEPDIDILPAAGEGAEDGQLQVKINGVDVFHPNTGEVRSDGADGIACWFIDTDYNEESFFVRHAYFLGANDPYKALKTTLKAEIDPDAWASLHSDISRPFNRPESGRVAVKVINHLGDEVMKVFRV